jgi:uncharacterized protein (UPF0276 family)
MIQGMTTARVGIGWRPELAGDLLRNRTAVDFVEVVAETCFAHAAARREARAIAELWPVVPHGVKLSLGSADGIDLDRALRLGALARELAAPAISEHVALTRAGSREIGHLTALPFTHEAVAVLARNVAAARRHFPDVPFLLENIAWTFRWPEDAMAEGDFYQEVVKATGCDLLLDVANLFANAQNAGADPLQALLSYPLDRVAMVHVAGGALTDGFYEDSHAHDVPEAVFDLVEQLLARTGPLPIILERDGRFPPFCETVAEVGRLRAIASRHDADRVRPTGPHSPSRLTGSEVLGTASLTERQARLADWITGDLPEDGETYGFDAVALRRTRAVLQHKRIDEVMPLLPRTAALGEVARGSAFAALQRAPRATRSLGIADAFRVARLAAGDPRLASAAVEDLLELRSRFVASGSEGPRPRRGPFLGRARLPNGRRLWAVKGPGSAAPVRFFEIGGER